MIPSENPTRSVAASSIQKRRLGLIICLAISAGMGLVWLVERNSSPSFAGTLQAKVTVVSSNRSGKANQVSVRTGQSVIPGDALIQLIDPQLEQRQTVKRREIIEFEAEVARAKAIADIELAWRRRDLQAEIFETQLKITSLSQEKLNKQVEEIAWKERLSQGDLGAGQVAAGTDFPFRPISMEINPPDDRRMQALLREDAAAAAAETLTLQIALCEKRLKKLLELDQEIESKIRASAGIEVAATRLQGAVQELESIEGLSKDCLISSPTYGTVGEVKLQPGDVVAQGAMLIEILDESQPHVVAQIPAGIAARLNSGFKVNLIFPMNQRRTGTISTIAPRTNSTFDATEAHVSVKIEPAGKLWPKLAFGSTVKVVLQ